LRLASGEAMPLGRSAPDASERGAPHNLPHHLSSFVGRRQELRALHSALRSARLVTLAGAGGIGKTRLALEVARAQLHDYPDGVWFVDLAPVGDPAFVPQARAAVLGIPDEHRRALIETLERALDGRRCMLLVDNCEHLLVAAA